jgi:hypothetical protein
LIIPAHVWFAPVFVNRSVFIHANGAFEDIDGADEDEGVADDGFEV